MDKKYVRQDDEIDLLYFLKPATNFISKIKDVVSYYLYLLYLNKWLFILIVLAGSALGYGLRYVFPVATVAEGYYTSKLLPGNYCASMITRLDDMVKDKSKTALLASRLKVPQATAAKLNSIKYLPLSDSFLVAGTTSPTKASFKIIINLKDETDLDTIQSGIQLFLEDNPFVIRKKQDDIKYLAGLKAYLEEKILSLDSLKNSIDKNLQSGHEGKTVLLLGESFNTVNLFQTQKSFYEEKMKIEERLANMNNIETIQPLAVNMRYKMDTFNKMFNKALMVSVLAAFLFTPLLGKKYRKASL